jgi:hypothetical protein
MMLKPDENACIGSERRFRTGADKSRDTKRTAVDRKCREGRLNGAANPL